MASRPAVRRMDGRQPFVARMLDDAAERAPPQYAGYIRAVKPAVVGAANFCDAAFPYVVMAYHFLCNVWKQLEPYNPEQFFPLIAGLAMCFFGGSYLTLIAAVEAVRLSVWDRLYAALQVLYKNYKLAQEANKKDNQRDDDNDGIADVDQVSNSELFTRKVYVLAQAINPEQTSDAVSAVWGGFLSVLATIRIKFAQFITLGVAMGDMARDAVGPKLLPFIHDALPPELKKWDQTIVRQIFATLGVMLAMFLQTVVGGFHAAVRGSQIATGSAFRLAKAHNLIDKDFDTQGQQASAVGLVLAAAGFLWQLRNGFAVPFPLNVLFLPATILEAFLSLSLTVGL
jgi:hypothetical protein